MSVKLFGISYTMDRYDKETGRTEAKHCHKHVVAETSQLAIAPFDDKVYAVTGVEIVADDVWVVRVQTR